MSAPMIFISYAREDEQTARQVFADLARAGFSPWLDKENLSPGSQWEVEIPKAIKSSDIFLALVSSKSLNKNGYVQREIQFALAVVDKLPIAQTFVIPARLDDCRLEDQRLREATWVDLFPSLNDRMPSLTAAVRKHIAPAPTRADERLAMLQVKLEAFWRYGGKRVLNCMLARARIGELMAADMTDDLRDLKQRVQRLFGDFGTLTPPAVSFARFSSDGKFVVAEYANGVNLFWDVETSALLNIGGLFLTNRFLNAASTRLLQPLEYDGLIHSVGTDRAEPVRLVGHTAPIRVCAFSDDATRILTGSQDGTARLWDAITGDPLMVMDGHPDWVTAVALSPDGKHAATGSGSANLPGDQRVRLWDLRTKRLKTLLKGHPPGPGLWDLAFSPSGDNLVSASLDGSVCLWDCDYLAKVADMHFHKMLVQSARFSPDGSKIVTASMDGCVVVWPILSRIEALDEAADQLRKP